MIAETEAKRLLMDKLSRGSLARVPVRIIDEKTVSVEVGWVFFYQSDRFLATGDKRSRLLGNGPAIVNRHTGEVVLCSSAGSWRQCLTEYEARLRPPETA